MKKTLEDIRHLTVRFNFTNRNQVFREDQDVIVESSSLQVLDDIDEETRHYAQEVVDRAARLGLTRDRKSAGIKIEDLIFQRITETFEGLERESTKGGLIPVLVGKYINQSIASSLCEDFYSIYNSHWDGFYLNIEGRQERLNGFHLKDVVEVYNYLKNPPDRSLRRQGEPTP